MDYAGFVPVDPRVLAVMTPFLEGWVGNPSAIHTLGQEARESLAAARAKIARLVGGRPDGVIFTGGATESNNLAIKGVALRGSKRHLITTAIEHTSVLTPCRDLVKHGFDVTVLPVDAEGRLEPERVRAAFRPDTALVSVGAANAEIGTIQPWRAIAEITRQAGVPFHVDGVGAMGRVPLAVEPDGIDLLTVSANDLYGPPGVGALWVRQGVRLLPQLLGGGQEEGLRSGTENLAGVVGLGVAAELALREGRVEGDRLRALRDLLLEGLAARCAAARLTGPRERRLPHHVSLIVGGIKGESLLLALDLVGISASTGSACAAVTREPSHVLRAIGLEAREAEGSLCVTLGRWTQAEDVQVLLAELPVIVERLRALSPLA
ncbi:MAG: cysteine desulfurase family protein [Candidatus Rokuibacteriota bacterium]